MTFGEESGFGADGAECRRMFEAFLAAGGNFIDTANIYTSGTSERLLAGMIAAERGRLVVASKFSMTTDPRDPNAGGNSRKNLQQSLEATLRRLGTDYLDLYWVHAWDGMTPLEELLRALDDAVRAGKLLYTGFSNVPAWVVARAQTMAELQGWSRFAALQLHYSLVERGVERELLPCAAALGLAVTAWSPLGGGVLSGKYSSDPQQRAAQPGRLTTTGWGRMLLSERNLAIAATVRELAGATGRTAPRRWRCAGCCSARAASCRSSARALWCSCRTCSARPVSSSTRTHSQRSMRRARSSSATRRRCSMVPQAAAWCTASCTRP